MLNLHLQENTLPEIKDMLVELRRVQVSRFPIDVHASVNDHNMIRFQDSRFPTDSFHFKNNLAGLAWVGNDDKGRPIFKLHSKRIQNAKYNEYNDNYNTRETTDMKKMAKFLREVVKPYTPKEIVDMSSDITSDRYEWKNEPAGQLRRMVSQLGANDIAAEIMYLQSVGVQFRSEKFALIASEGIELYKEAKRRQDIEYINVHVYVQPDESVLVTTANDKSYSYENLAAVPEFVQQQVAMLMMVDMKQYVPEVGKRMSDKMYWVHVNPDIFND